jgi:hypothetical protein
MGLDGVNCELGDLKAGEGLTGVRVGTEAHDASLATSHKQLHTGVRNSLSYLSGAPDFTANEPAGIRPSDDG